MKLRRPVLRIALFSTPRGSVISQRLFMKRLRDRDRDDVTARGQLIDIDGTFPLTCEGNFMLIPPLVGLDLDTISRRLPYLA